MSGSSSWPVVGIVVLGLALAYFMFSPGSGSLVSLGSQGGFAGSSYSAPGSSGGSVDSSAQAGQTPSSSGSKSSDGSGSGGGSYLGEGIAGLVAVILLYFLLKGGLLGKLASGGSRILGGAFGRIFGSGGKLKVKPARDKLFFGEQTAIAVQFASGPGVPVPGFVVLGLLSGPSGVSLEKNGALAAGDELDPSGRRLKLILDAQGNASALFTAGAEKGTAKLRVLIPAAGAGSVLHEKNISIKIVPPPKPKAQAVTPAAAPAVPPVQPQPAGAPKKAPGLLGRLVFGSDGKFDAKPAKDKLFFGEQAAVDARFVPSGPGVPAPGFIAFEIVSGPSEVSLEKNGFLAPGDEIDQANDILKLVPDTQGTASALFSAGDEKGNAKIRIFTIPTVPGSVMHEKNISIKIVPPPKPKAQAIKRIDVHAKSAAPSKSDFALVLKAEPSKIAFGEVSKISAKPVCKDGSVDLSKIDEVKFSIFEVPGGAKAPAGVSLSSGDTSVSAGYELSAGIVRGAALVLLRAGNEAGKVELRAYCYLPSSEGVDAKSVSVKIVPKHGVSVKDHIKDLKGIYSRTKESIEGSVSKVVAGALSISFEPGPRALGLNDKLELKAKIISRKKGVDASKFGSVYFEVIGDAHGAYIGDENAFRHSKNKARIYLDPTGSASVYFSSGREKGKVIVRAFFYKDAYNLEPVHSSKLSIDIRETLQAKKPGGSKPIARPETATAPGAAMDMSRVSLHISPDSPDLSFGEKREISIWFAYDNEALNAPVIPEVHVDIAKTVPPGVKYYHKVKYGWRDNTGSKDFNIPVNSKGIAILEFIAGAEAGEFPFRISCFIEPGRQLSAEGRVKILSPDEEDKKR